jgi:transglutaminase-like putative cysteine protease
MRIHAGYEIALQCAAPTPLLGLLSVHPTRIADLVSTSGVTREPAGPMQSFVDAFGNACTRLTAPEGILKLRSDFVIEAKPSLAPGPGGAAEVPVEQLPDAVVQYLLGSRYCETDKLSSAAWSLFGSTPRGYARVQAIARYVQEQITFDYEYASATRSACGVYRDRRGVWRDFVHLAVTFCRCMNIPARYCTGYRAATDASDTDAPTDFAAWMEVYLDGGWYAFGPRDAGPLAGNVRHVLMATGRDAADVPIYTTFGPSELVGFRVFADAL